MVNSLECPQWLKTLLADVFKQRHDFPGIQLAISSPYLTCKTSVGDELTVNTPWRIASITKTFTAVTILQLAEQGDIDLHGPAVKYLPEWGTELLRRTILNADQITTWQLLHHTSGLGHHTDERFMEVVKADPQRHWSLQEILEWAKDHTTSVTPGTFHYSDTGYTYLGLIIENLAGLFAAVRATYKDLYMPSTYWELNGPHARQLLGDLDVTNWEPSFDFYGAGGMVSNSEDLNTYTRALHTGKIIEPNLMYQTESSGFYACGILKTNFAGHEAWGHTGFWGSWSYYIPALDLVFSGSNNQAVKPMFDLEKLVKAVIENCPEAGSRIKS